MKFSPVTSFLKGTAEKTLVFCSQHPPAKSPWRTLDHHILAEDCCGEGLFKKTNLTNTLQTTHNSSKLAWPFKVKMMPRLNPLQLQDPISELWISLCIFLHQHSKGYSFEQIQWPFHAGNLLAWCIVSAGGRWSTQRHRCSPDCMAKVSWHSVSRNEPHETCLEGQVGLFLVLPNAHSFRVFLPAAFLLFLLQRPGLSLGCSLPLLRGNLGRATCTCLKFRNIF